MSPVQGAMYRALGTVVGTYWAVRDQTEARGEIKRAIREMRRLRYPGYAVARYRPRTLGV